MGGDDLHVKFGGDTSALDAASNRAAADINKVEQSGAKLSGSFSKLGGVFQNFHKNLSGEHVEGYSRKLEGVFSTMKGGMGSVAGATSSIEGLSGGMTGLGQTVGVLLGSMGPAGWLIAGFLAIGAAAFAAIQPILAFGEKMADAAEHMDNLSQKTGIAIEDLSKFGLVAQAIGLSADAFGMGMVRLERNLVMGANGSKRMAGAMKEIGVSAADLNNPKEVMLKMADAFSRMEDGGKKNAIAMTLMGRAGVNMIPMLNQGREAIERQAKTAEEYGATVDKAFIQKGLAVDEAFDKNKFAMQGLKNVLFDELAPAILATVNYMNGLIKEMVQSYKQGGIVKDMLDGLSVLFKICASAVMAFVFAVREMILYVKISLGPVSVLKGLISGGWSGGTQAIKDFSGNVAKLGTNAINTANSLKGLWWGSMPKPIERIFPKAGGDGFSMSGMGGGGAKHAGGGKQARDHSALDAELEDLNIAMDAVKDDYEKRMALEEQRLAKIKAFYGEASRQYKAELRTMQKMAADHLVELDKIEQRKVVNRQKSAELIASTDNSIRDTELSSAQQHFSELDNLGLVNTGQRIAQEEAFHQQEQSAAIAHEDLMFSIASASIQDQLALLHLPREEREKLNLELEASTEAHEQRMRLIVAKGAADEVKVQDSAVSQIMRKWQDSIAPIEGAFTGMFTSLSQGTTSFKQATLSALDQIFSGYVQMGIKSLFHHQAMEHAKTVATAVGARGRVAVEQTANHQSILSSAASALKQIAHKAAVAAAGAYAAIASIPIVGPFLAPAAAAAALFGVMKLAQSVFSAEGGWGEVPSDGMNTTLHKKEMVLPAQFAVPLRQLLLGQGPSQGGLAGMANKAANDARTSNDNNSATFNYQPNHTNQNADLSTLLAEDGATLRRWFHNEMRNGSLKIPGRR